MRPIFSTIILDKASYGRWNFSKMSGMATAHCAAKDRSRAFNQAVGSTKVGAN